jgi:hypothetical protein
VIWANILLYSSSSPDPCHAELSSECTSLAFKKRLWVTKFTKSSMWVRDFIRPRSEDGWVWIVFSVDRTESLVGWTVWPSGSTSPSGRDLCVLILMCPGRIFQAWSSELPYSAFLGKHQSYVNVGSPHPRPHLMTWMLGLQTTSSKLQIQKRRSSSVGGGSYIATVGDNAGSQPRRKCSPMTISTTSPGWWSKRSWKMIL